MDLGFTAEKLVRKKHAKKEVSDSAILSLRLDAKGVCVRLIQKLLERSPRAYPLAKSMTCLDPAVMCDTPDEAQKLMRKTLSTLSSSSQVNEGACDVILNQVQNFKRDQKPQIVRFNQNIHRLDTFLKEITAKEYPELWGVFKKLLLLSHRQAKVEFFFCK